MFNQRGTHMNICVHIHTLEIEISRHVNMRLTNMKEYLKLVFYKYIVLMCVNSFDTDLLK